MARFHFSLRSRVPIALAHPVVSQRSLRALNLVEVDADNEWAGPGRAGSIRAAICCVASTCARSCPRTHR